MMVKSFILMLQFLTRLPINKNIDMDKDTITKGTLFFPFIGMIIGTISGIVYYLLSFINKDVASLGAVFAIVFVTGGLHLDGLSDTADGFFSGRDRNRILEIMKDSRIGSFGVIAIVFVLLSKYVLIKSLNHDVIKVIILSCGLARLGISMLFSFGKTVRQNGLGSMFTNSESRKYFFISLIIFSAIGYLIKGNLFLIALFCSMVSSLIIMKYSYKVIGGLTGDVYGAACEILEVICIFIFLVVMLWI
ncbi:cobalamin-5'-phosphate synthase [Caloramator quimbayensis]|uniref:Adenosylcobinamide-GDP ribazoletransferase n=1 Tax=Caloramator quimbayensis TaxID=1147123 RepID=A0A1T4WZZ9_9CLOT|nr:adenosylcobinamide-GDP ribazoletransferase [Caloramator quimbayensis]SKA82920.1 cobalamin-5'-phosphate synthase [Caloramator quimbayensis]